MQLDIVISHKRGDSLNAACVYKDEDGVPISLAGITIASQVRTPRGVLISNCVVAVTNEVGGAFSLDIDDTSMWPVGMLEWDIQYSYDSIVISTETVGINVLRDVTQS